MVAGASGLVLEVLALVTAAGAVGTFRTARVILQEMRDNRDRSKKNRKLITGEDTHREGLFSRVSSVEREVQELRQERNGGSDRAD